MTKKILTSILLFFIFFMCSCNEEQAKIKNINELMQKVKDETSITNAKSIKIEDFCAFFGANKEDIKDFCGIENKKNSFENEIIFIETKDSQSLNETLKTIKNINNQKLNQAISYNSDQRSILEKRVLFSKGNFIFSVISEDSEKIEEIIKENF